VDENLTIGHKGIFIDGPLPLLIESNFSNLTQLAGVSDLTLQQDGYKHGILTEVDITHDGTVVGKYDNRRSRDLAKIALANFQNPEALERLGDGMFAQSENSGNPIIGEPTISGRGRILSRHLELSNVDLTEEFTNMIIAERSFQANVRTISAADRLVMELMRIRG
jgi:flagellar hook protein FlgE